MKNYFFSKMFGSNQLLNYKKLKINKIMIFEQALNSRFKLKVKETEKNRLMFDRITSSTRKTITKIIL